MKKPWRREEWLLFLAPVVILLVVSNAARVRRAYFPDPIPTPTPAPKTKPIPNLWSAYFEYFRLLPAHNGKVIYTVGSSSTSRFKLHVWDAKTGNWRRSFCSSGAIRRDGVALSDDDRILAYTALASLRADESLSYNTEPAFAPDHSTLYFVPHRVAQWPRTKWKIGASYSQIRAPEK